MTKLLRLIFRPELKDKVGLSYPTIWKLMRRGEFPRSRRLGEGKFARVAWLESEIEEWIQSRPRQVLKGDNETPKKDAAQAANQKRRRKVARGKYSPKVSGA